MAVSGDISGIKKALIEKDSQKKSSQVF